MVTCFQILAKITKLHKRRKQREKQRESVCACVCVGCIFAYTRLHRIWALLPRSSHTQCCNLIIVLCCFGKNVAMRGEGEKKDCFTELEFHAFKDDIYNPYQT